MAKIYYEKDADLDVVKDKTIAIAGYGSQGHPQAQSVRDGGLNVIVAELEGTDNYKLAKSHGFNPVCLGEAAEAGDLIQVLIPDEVQGKAYKAEVAF